MRHPSRLASLRSLAAALAVADIMILAHVRPSTIIAQLVTTLPMALVFAAQTEVQGYVASRALRAEHDFGIGDSLTTGPYSGMVIARGIRRVRLRTLDGRTCSVPNTYILTNGCIVGRSTASRS